MIYDFQLVQHVNTTLLSTVVTFFSFLYTPSNIHLMVINIRFAFSSTVKNKKEKYVITCFLDNINACKQLLFETWF